MTPADGTLLDVLDLEEVDRDLYRSTWLVPDRWPLYGGQVAAQALRAAGLTVGPDRTPHSLHGYFLRAGQAERPVVFQVHRDRDGRSFSARRVVALQGGEVVFSVAASFAVEEDGPDEQVGVVPEVPSPEDGDSYAIPRLVGMEGRSVPQPAGQLWPTRFWARSSTTLDDDPLLHACVLTYLSDISTGLVPMVTAHARPGPSLDHALWFHRPVRLDDWVLLDAVPGTAARGRGWYTGTVHDRHGLLAASLTQEQLFRPVRG